jgi:hypothetical protein
MAMMENIAIRDEPAAEGETDATGGVERSRALLPEQLGDYRIIREIGHGGMGVVYDPDARPPEPGPRWAILAMAHARQGRPDEAMKCRSGWPPMK